MVDKRKNVEDKTKQTGQSKFRRKQEPEQEQKQRHGNHGDDRGKRNSSSSSSKVYNKPRQKVENVQYANISQVMGNSKTTNHFPVSTNSGASVGKNKVEETTNEETRNSSSNLKISKITQEIQRQFKKLENFLLTEDKSSVSQLQKTQFGKSVEGKYKCKNIRALFINNRFNSIPQKSWDEKKRNWYNSLNRLGSEHDETKMKDLFHQLGIKLDYVENLVSSRLEGTIRGFKEDCLPDCLVDQHDGCIVIIGTHGGSEPSSLLMEDLKCVHLWRDVIFKFGRDQFQGFQGPKIFLVNACREDVTSIPIPDSNSLSTCGEKAEIKEEETLNLEDILVGLSTNTMNFSYRTPAEGSLYLHFIHQVLSQELQNGDESSDLKYLLDFQVSPKVAEFLNHDSKERQIPVSISLLFKQFHFKKQT